MKSVILGSMLLLGSLVASANESTRLLEVRLNSGFTPPVHSYYVKCAVTSTMVTTESRKGNATTPDFSSAAVVWTKEVPNEKTALVLLNAAAKSRSLTEEMGPTDGPSSVFTGILEGTVVDRMVKLYIDYSEVRYTNPSKGVKALVEFGRANCARP